MEPDFLIKADPAGRQLMTKFRSQTASFHWGDYQGNTLSNGSMFFVYTERALLR